LHEPVSAAPEVLAMGAAGPAGGCQAGVAAAAARLGRRAVAVTVGLQHELDFGAIRGAGVLWVTLEALTAEPGRSAALAAMESRGRRGHTILDLDCAPELWAPELSALELLAPELQAREQQAREQQAAADQRRRWAREGLDWASLATGDLAACAAATGAASPVPVEPVPVGQGAVDPGDADPAPADPVPADPVDVGWALLGHGVRLAVIRYEAGEVLGMDTARQVQAGSRLASTELASTEPASTEPASTEPASTADPGGPGAAFGAALCHGLLEGWELAQLTRFAAAAVAPGDRP
jgi:5-dehydro-2-deoxygluconokinase